MTSQRSSEIGPGPARTILTLLLGFPLIYQVLNDTAKFEAGEACTSMEAYGEDDKVLPGGGGGACAADVFAGPGCEEWPPKAKTERRSRRSKAKGEKALKKRIAQLLKELLDGWVYSCKQKKSKPKTLDHSEESSEDSSSDSESGSEWDSDSPSPHR